MVEVTLEGYISVHRCDRTDLTPPADSYMRIVPACAVVSVPQVDSRYLQKKTRVGFQLGLKRQGRFKSMVEVTLNRYISGHRRDRTNLRTLAGSYIPVLPACTVVYLPQVDLRYLKKKTRVGFGLVIFQSTSTLD